VSGEPRAAAAALPRRFLYTAMSRAGWNIVDQALSSLTNAALSIFVARSVDANSFGAFAICFSVYSFVVGVTRGLVSDPLTVRFSDASRDSFRTATRSAVAAATAVGGAAGALLLVAAITQSGDLRHALVALALTMPGLTLQDALRLSFITQGRPRAAAANDFIWGVLQLGGAGLLLYGDVANASVFVAVWGAAAAVAAFYGIFQSGFVPRARGMIRWVREQLHLSGFFVAEYTVVMGTFQITLLLVGVIGEVSDVGSLRAAQVLLGPLSVLGYGMWLFAFPEIARRRALPQRSHVTYALALSGSLFLATLIWGALLLQLPDAAGRQVLGDAWEGGRAVVPAMIATLAGIAATLGPACVVKAFGAARDMLRMSVLLAALLLPLGLIGASRGGAEGAALGFAIAQWIPLPFWWARMLKVTGEGRTPAPVSRSEGRPE
jgi:O-antigen/teichoic acid export membrane protein